MSRSAYSRIACHLCGQPVSTAGFAQYNHKMKHVREGRMTARRPDYSESPYLSPQWEFTVVKTKEPTDGE